MRTLIIALFLFTLCFQAKAQTLDAFWTYTFTNDTITDSEIDTLLLPADFTSPWSYAFHVVTDSLSGTDTLAFTVQESILKSGTTDWVTIASGTGSKTVSPVRINAALMYGRRVRLIIRGSGTQSTTYAVTFLAKKIYK